MKSPAMFVAILLTGFLLTACSQEPPPGEQKDTAAQPPAAKSTDMTAKVEQPTQDTVGTVKQDAEPAVETARQKPAEAVETAQQQTSEKVDQVQTAAADITRQAEKTETGMLPAAATQAATAAGSAPDTVVYQATMGKVTFNHAEHASRLDCSRCHTNDPPQKIAIDKEVAHNQLCKVCHQESGGKAPTGCTGCHKK